MIRRLRWDESGVALGLAVIVVVLIGVMGAGFLVTMRSDLGSVISMNRGQRALVLADSGAQAAAAQLRSDANPAHYDGDASGNAEWAYVSPDGGVPGMELVLEGGRAKTTIRYLTPATSAAQQRDRDHAPVPVPAGLADYLDRDFFLIVSEGASGEARRKVEVILYARTSGETHEVGQWSWREVYR